MSSVSDYDIRTMPGARAGGVWKILTPVRMAPLPVDKPGQESNKPSHTDTKSKAGAKAALKT